MGLTRQETETVINFNDAESVAYVMTRQARVKTRLKKLGFSPHHKQADYEVYIVPKKSISFRGATSKKVLSEDQKRAAANRLAEARRAKNK